MGNTVRSVTVALKAEVASYIASMKQAKEETSSLFKELDKAHKADKLDDLQKSMVVAGAGMVAFAGYAIKSAAEFDAAMSKVSAATHASAADLDQLRAAALAAGKATSFSASEAAQGITELAKAGVSTQDILKGGLKGALSLAAAGELSVGEAAETAATAITQFGLSGAQVPHVADLLAAAAGKAQGEVHDMGFALKMAGLVASQFGISIEETTGTLAAFAAAGLIGSDAGTSLKVMLLRLGAPTDQAAQLMRSLGINAYDTSGKFVGLQALAGQLQKALSGLTQQQRDAALAHIFGADAIRAANVLYRNGAAGISDWVGKVNESGYAADTAARKTDNLTGDLERLHGTLDTIAIQSGSGGASGLRLIVKAADALATSFANANPIVSSIAVILVGMTGILMLGVAGWLQYRKVVAEAVLQLEAVGPAGARAATALQLTTKWAGRATAAFIALQVLNTVGSMFASEAPNVERMADALTKVANSGDVSGKALKSAGLDLTQFAHDLKFVNNMGGMKGLEKAVRLEPGFMSAFDASAQSTMDRMKGLDAVLAQMVQSGNGEQARVMFNQLAEVALKQGKGMAWLIALLPGYQDAINKVVPPTSAIAAAQAESNKQSELLSGSWTELIEKAKDLKSAFDMINGAHINFFDAQRHAVQATNDLKKALEESDGAVDNSSEKSMAAGESLSKWIATQRDLIKATYDQAVANGETVTATDQAREAYERSRAALIEMVTAITHNKEQAEALVAQLFRMPPLTTIAIEAPTAVTITEKLNALENKLRVISRSYYVDIFMNEVYTSKRQRDDAQYNSPQNRWGGLYQHAAIGTLREADIYSARSPGRYMIAEPQTGGEAFIPKYGNYARNMAILSKAAAWNGAQVIPRGGAGRAGGGVTVNVPAINVYGVQDPAAVAREVRVQINEVARRADLLLRAG